MDLTNSHAKCYSQIVTRILLITVGSASFSIGMHVRAQERVLASDNRFPSPDRAGSSREPRTVPTVAFCDLASNPERYDQKVVRLRAIYVTGFEQSFLYSPRCNGADTFVWAARDRSYQLNSATDRSLDAVLADGGRADVVVLGQFRAPAGNRYGHLDQFRMQLLVRRFETAKAVSPKTPKSLPKEIVGSVGDAQRIVRQINNDFIFYMAGVRSGFPSYYLADDFRLIDSEGRASDKMNFVRTIARKYSGTVSNADIRVHVTGGIALATGEFTLTDRSGERRYRYVNNYVRRGDWRILSSKIANDGSRASVQNARKVQLKSQSSPIRFWDPESAVPAEQMLTGQKPIKCKHESSENAPSYRVGWMTYSVEGPKTLFLAISIDPRGFSGTDMAALARRVRADYCQERRLVVSILDNYDAARAFGPTSEKVWFQKYWRCVYFLDLGSGEEWIEFSTRPDRPRDEVRINLTQISQREKKNSAAAQPWNSLDRKWHKPTAENALTEIEERNKIAQSQEPLKSYKVLSSDTYERVLDILFPRDEGNEDFILRFEPSFAPESQIVIRDPNGKTEVTEYTSVSGNIYQKLDRILANGGNEDATKMSKFIRIQKRTINVSHEQALIWYESFVHSREAYEKLLEQRLEEAKQGTGTVMIDGTLYSIWHGKNSREAIFKEWDHEISNREITGEFQLVQWMNGIRRDVEMLTLKTSAMKRQLHF